MKIGLSSCGKTINAELFENYHKAGIQAVELSLKPDEYPSFDFQKTMRMAKDCHVIVWSCHLPFTPFSSIEPSSPDSQVRLNTVKYHSELIRKAADAGIDKFVVHPSGEPIEEKDRPERLKWAEESLHELAKTAAEVGAKVAVENLPRTCLGRNSEEILKLIDADSELRVCFDTNHLLCEKLSDFIYNVGDKIITTHISDYDFVDERHWLPGEGKIDWQELLQALKRVKYDEMWMYELGFHSKVLNRPRDLVCEDFAKNANSIFDGKDPFKVE